MSKIRFNAEITERVFSGSGAVSSSSAQMPFDWYEGNVTSYTVEINFVTKADGETPGFNGPVIFTSTVEMEQSNVYSRTTGGVYIDSSQDVINVVLDRFSNRLREVLGA